MTNFRRGFLACAIFAMSAPIAARAATITVVTQSDLAIIDGFCSLREAILSARLDVGVDTCAAGELAPDRIEIPTGTYPVFTPLVVTGSSGPLELRGLPGPTRPSLVGNGSPHTILRIESGQEVTLDRLQISLGSPGVLALDSDLVVRDSLLGLNPGRALTFESDSSGSLLVERSVISNNNAVGRGGGIDLFLIGATARIVDSTISQNVVASDGTQAVGGGLSAFMPFGGSLEVERTVFEQNRCTPPAGLSAQGSGVYVRSFNFDVLVKLVDVAFRGNDAVATPADGHTGALFLTLWGEVALDRLRFEHNDPGEEGMQLWIETETLAPVSIQNVLFADGPMHAMRVFTDDAVARLGHLTAWDHAGSALRLLSNAGEIRLDNSIVWGNGSAIEPSGDVVIGPTNVIDVDPMFADAVGGDFTLLPGSPAIDAGDATVLPMPSFDLAHAPRVAGLDADAGAFERGGLFGDDFESSDLSAWSSISP